MWGAQAINSDKTMQSYVDKKPDRAVKNIKDVTAVYRYHQIPEIKTTLVAQSNRIRDMFNTMDAAIKVAKPKYEEMELGPLWATWMRGRADRARTEAETYMNHWVKALQTAYGTPTQRTEANADQTVLLARIDALATEVTDLIKAGWSNPL